MTKLRRLEDVINYFATPKVGDQRFSVITCEGAQPSEDDLAAFEEEVGFALPADFRRFTLSSLGSLYMEAKEELWPRPEIGDVGPAWTSNYAIRVFGIAEGIPPWLDLRNRYQELRGEGVEGLVPFLQIEGDADLYCFDKTGAVVKWRHDELELEACEESFPSVLLREIADLEKRCDRISAAS